MKTATTKHNLYVLGGGLDSRGRLTHIAVGSVVVVGILREGLQARCVGSRELPLGAVWGDAPRRGQLAHEAPLVVAPVGRCTTVTAGLFTYPGLVGGPGALGQQH